MTRQRRFAGTATAFIALFIVATVALAFVVTLAFADATTTTIQVDLLHGFTPSVVDVKTGSTIVWQNIDKADYPVVRGAHTVTADDGKTFDSGEIAPGASFSFTFLKPGNYAYHCKIHPQLMSGTLAVTGPAITPPSTQKEVSIVEPKDTTKWGYDPSEITGVVGLTITWRNNGAQDHTVTVDGLFDSKNIKPGQTFTRTFTKAASLSYYCTIHTWMKGTVRIAAAGGALPPPPPPVKADKSGASGAVGAPQQPPISSSGPLTFHVNVIEPANPNDWGFAPSALQARVGDTIVWTNQGQAQHTITATNHAFDSGTLNAGGTYTFRPNAVGNLAYICSIHPWMKGTLAIAAAGTVPTQVLGETFKSGGNSSASNPTATQQPGAQSQPSDAPAVEPVQSKGRTRLGAVIIAALLVFGAALLWPTLLELRRPRFRGPLPQPHELVELPHADVKRSIDERERELVGTR